MKCKITADVELRDDILKRLTENANKYGARYCPCIPVSKYKDINAKDYICPCKDFRENTKIGDECYCGLLCKIEE